MVSVHIWKINIEPEKTGHGRQTTQEKGLERQNTVAGKFGVGDAIADEHDEHE